jgi:hypothetical protein
VADVLTATARAGGDAVIARAVRDWAAPPNYRITVGTGRTYQSFTVRAGTAGAAGPALWAVSCAGSCL